MISLGFQMCHYEFLVLVDTEILTAPVSVRKKGKKINGHSDVLQLKCCPFI